MTQGHNKNTHTQNRLPYCVAAAKILATKQKDSRQTSPNEMKSNPFTKKTLYCTFVVFTFSRFYAKQ